MPFTFAVAIAIAVTVTDDDDDLWWPLFLHLLQTGAPSREGASGEGCTCIFHELVHIKVKCTKRKRANWVQGAECRVACLLVLLKLSLKREPREGGE